jgi:hypothetical protein
MKSQTHLKLVQSAAGRPDPYGDRKPDTSRPFRLYDAKANRFLRWRCYASKRNAHNGALVEVRWSKGEVIEVIDVRYGRWLATYRLAGGQIFIVEPE